eukprot:PhM_4_TR12744/c0_g3_i1/m.15353
MARRAQDETGTMLARLCAYTLCMEPYAFMRKCAEANDITSERVIQKDHRCMVQYKNFVMCREEKMPEVVQWCLIAEGCDDPRRGYFSCMTKNGGDADDEQMKKSHEKCMGEYEKMIQCGAKNILKEFEKKMLEETKQ